MRRLLNLHPFCKRLFTHVAILVSLFIAPAWVMAEAVKQDVLIESKVNKQELKFEVYVPSDYKDKPLKRYPVLLTTAGRSRLPIFVEQVNWSSHTSFSPMPKVIVVTLPDVELDKFTGASGVLDKVITQVLAEDVLPYVDQTYRTQPFRIMEGFSSWGNLPLYVFKNAPELFDAYFVLSPALELDKSGLIESFNGFEADKRYLHKYLYLSLGTFTGNRTEFDKLSNYLRVKNTGNNLVFHSQDLSHLNYLSGPLIGLDAAATALFSDLSPEMAMFDKSGVAGLKLYYQELEQKYGYDLDIESSIIDLGFHFADNKQVEKALKTMAHIVDHNSDNPLLLIRLASVKQRAGLSEEALKTFGVALSVARKKKDEEAESYIKMRMADLESSE